MTAARARPQLKLRTGNLDEREIAKIGAFLRVGGHRFLCDWSVVIDGPCHVLVQGDPQQEVALVGARGPAAILRVHETRDDQHAGALVRPLQYDAFVDALSALERKLVVQATAPAPSARVAAATPAAPLARESVPARRTFHVSPQARLRLRRWPPAAILGAHRYNVRLASFMSGRHVGLDELVQLSNVDKVQCEQFLVALSDAEILDVKVADAASPPPRLEPGRAEPLPRHAAVDMGLLGRLRRHLGLGRSQ
jgi:hypothetical protein